jgi:Type VI secretion system (T6SS), amidase effector protein 4
MPTFATLWGNHPTIKGDSPLLDTKVYENQCAINLSAALMRSGIEMNNYTGVWSWETGKTKYAIRAQELADWLAKPNAQLPSKVEKFVGKEVFSKTAGKTGIVFFQNYWGAGNQGDHIDLWNGSRLTDWRTWARIHVRLGNYGLHNLGAGSDFQKAQTAWFWKLP